MLVVVGALAAAVTYLELFPPSSLNLHNLLPQKLTTQIAKTAPSKPAAPAVVAPAPVAKAIKTATTTSLVHLRADKSVSSQNLTNLDPGTAVQLRDDSDATWQGVIYQGQNGYIYRDYLQY